MAHVPLEYCSKDDSAKPLSPAPASVLLSWISGILGLCSMALVPAVLASRDSMAVMFVSPVAWVVSFFAFAIGGLAFACRARGAMTFLGLSSGFLAMFIISLSLAFPSNVKNF
jgi:hypothetical protein